MSGNCISGTCPGNLACRYDTARGWFVDALSLAAAAAAIWHYNPGGVIATIIVLIGGYVIGRILGEVIWRASLTWLLLLTPLIYVCTFSYASSHLPLLPALLLTMFLPGIAQAYVIWDLWPATSSLLHPITVFCVAWLMLLAICMFEPATFGRLSSFIKARRPRL